jgi:hypothetical protein
MLFTNGTILGNRTCATRQGQIPCKESVKAASTTQICKMVETVSTTKFRCSIGVCKDFPPLHVDQMCTMVETASTTRFRCLVPKRCVRTFPSHVDPICLRLQAPLNSGLQSQIGVFPSHIDQICKMVETVSTTEFRCSVPNRRLQRLPSHVDQICTMVETASTTRFRCSVPKRCFQTRYARWLRL